VRAIRLSGIAAFAVLCAAVAVVVVVHIHNTHAQLQVGCTVNAVVLRPDQAKNAATIAAVGSKLGMPDHAVTVALAAALQESKLINLPGGDRDSGGLFQERPSEGWGTYDQVRDPVYAATVFFQHLAAIPAWEQLPVTEAAQQVEISGAPDAYAQWEPEARAIARAVTGEDPHALSCYHGGVATISGDIATIADAELGTNTISGPQPPARGWAMCAWLVTHATDFAIDSVTFGGYKWTAGTGQWTATSAPTDNVSYVVGSPQPTTPYEGH
jgi:hypothetical protein